MSTTITPFTNFTPFEHLNSMMEELFPNTPFLKGAWYPAVDIKETEKEYIFLAELPGMNREDIEVELLGNMLTIRGKRLETKEETREGFIRKERQFGSFYRSFHVDANVKPNQITADYKDGVLNVVVPKMLALKGQRVPIK